jgi:hypothetical protein
MTTTHVSSTSAIPGPASSSSRGSSRGSSSTTASSQLPPPAPYATQPPAATALLCMHKLCMSPSVWLTPHHTSKTMLQHRVCMCVHTTHHLRTTTHTTQQSAHKARQAAATGLPRHHLSRKCQYDTASAHKKNEKRLPPHTRKAHL